MPVPARQADAKGTSERTGQTCHPLVQQTHVRLGRERNHRAAVRPPEAKAHDERLRGAMSKPTMLAVDNDPQVLASISRDLPSR